MFAYELSHGITNPIPKDVLAAQQTLNAKRKLSQV